MAKAWMPFYIGDYLADTGHLTAEQHGVYVLSLFHYWQTNQPLTANAEQLQMICRCMDAAKFEQAWRVVSEFYSLEGGSWVNHRMDKELLKAAKLSETRAKAANKRYQPPPTKAPANAVLKQTQSQSQSQSKDKEPSQRKFTDDDLFISAWIFNKIFDLNRKTKQSNFSKWAETVRKIREIDGHDHRTICEVFKWANADDFWQSNILSPDKLRKQFSALQIKMNAGQNQQKVSSTDVLDEMERRIDSGANNTLQIDHH